VTLSSTPQKHEAGKRSNVVSRVPLGEIAEIVSGFGFPKELQGKMEGDLPFFKVGDISRVWNQGQRLLTQAEHYITQEQARQIRAKPFPRGTLVFAKIGEAIKLNRRAILGQPSIVDNNVMGLIPRRDLVDTLYVYYYMLTVKLGDISQATTVPSVRKSDVEGIGFPLVPIEMQKAIVAEIEKEFSRLDEAVVSLKRVQANLKRYKAAVLKAAVEGQLTEDWRKQHPNVEPASKLLERILAERRKKLGHKKDGFLTADGDPPAETPDGWTICSIDQITECLDAKRIPVNKTERIKRGGNIPYYGANGRVGVTDDYIFDEPLVLVVEDETFTGRTQAFSYLIQGKSCE
jgi:type I restriction enzyme S subunit